MKTIKIIKVIMFIASLIAYAVFKLTEPEIVDFKSLWHDLFFFVIILAAFVFMISNWRKKN